MHYKKKILFKFLILLLFPYKGFCVDISDYPLQASVLFPCPNIMFIIDNSGSMDLEIMTDEDNSAFLIDDELHEYIFDDSGDNNYKSGSSSTILDETDRAYWKSQWSGYNKIYYDPHFDYIPWPNTKTYPMNDASIKTAFSNPINTKINDPFIIFKNRFNTIDNIDIPNAHYFTWHDDNNNSVIDLLEVYLVVFTDSNSDNILDKRLYYKVKTDSNNKAIKLIVTYYDENNQGNDLVPNEIQPKNQDKDEYKTSTQDLQNFANWYSYYRRRELVAKAAIAHSIANLKGIYIGLYTINNQVQQPVLPVQCKESTENAVVSDNTNILLDLLYSIDSDGGTPLRQALINVGQYYDKDDGLIGGLGESPIKSEDHGGACQQSFAIIITDGYYNGNALNIGNEDLGKGVLYQDIYSNTLADAAMKYYNTDLVDNLYNNLRTNEYDKQKTQHMITYTIAFGIRGTIDIADINNDGVLDNPSYRNDPHFLDSKTLIPVWTDPAKGDLEKIDDLWHAAVNGRGEFFEAFNYQSLINSLNLLFKNLTEKVSSGSPIVISKNALSGNFVLFQTQFSFGINEEDTIQSWKGDVLAYPIDSLTGKIKKDDLIWSAAKKLSLMDWDTQRKIFTYNGYDSIVSFRYSNLSALQKKAINYNPDVIDYIRGKEISGFKKREQKLKDIVHSPPVFVNTSNKDSGMIFVGGNDGMLHAFDAKTGNEVFGYVPHLVFDNLIDLTDINYGHKFYVDGTSFIQDISINSKNLVLLSGGLRKGGKGYYCLDITNIINNNALVSKDTLSTSNKNYGIDVLWEYPSHKSAQNYFASDDDLGYSFSDIFIVQSYKNNNEPSNHNWIAVFSNGYNSVNGNAVLYILNAYTGKLIKKIDTGTSNDNGLSSPALVDVNNDQKLDFVYAGDLHGNMWKFDLTDSNSDNWSTAYSKIKPTALFTSLNQPITTAPDIMNHCEREDGYIVAFGTGKFIGESDKIVNTGQSIYGIWDRGVALGTWDKVNKSLSNIKDVSLLEQTQVGWQNSNDNLLRVISDNQPNWVSFDKNMKIESGSHIGWFFDLLIKGERLVQNVMIRDKKLLAITFVPEDSFCKSTGSSLMHEIKACDGKRLDSPSFDVNHDMLINENDMVMIRDPDNPLQQILIAPSAITYNEFLFSPAILKIPDKQYEFRIFNGSDTFNQQVLGKSTEGFYYWKELKE